MRKLSIVLFVVLLFAGCSARQHEITDRVIPATSDSWYAVQEAAIALYDAGVLRGEYWERANTLMDKGSLVMRNAWQLWKTERRIDEGDYLAIIDLIRQMQELITEARSANQKTGAIVNAEVMP